MSATHSRAVPAARAATETLLEIADMSRPNALTTEELAELHSLPDDALVTTNEAAAFLRISTNSLRWYRAQACEFAPPFTRIGQKVIRYRVGDLRAYAARKRPMGDGVRRNSDAMLAARAAKREQAHA